MVSDSPSITTSFRWRYIENGFTGETNSGNVDTGVVISNRLYKISEKEMWFEYPLNQNPIEIESSPSVEAVMMLMESMKKGMNICSSRFTGVAGIKEMGGLG